MSDKLQIVEESTNHPNGLTPSPLSLRRGGDKSPFLAHFQEISQARNWGEKGNFNPPLLKERGLGGEAQLQFITYFLAQTQRGVS